MYCRVFFASLALFLVTGCSRREDSGRPVRIAVLRFENLSPDGSLDWVGRGLSETLIGEIGAVPMAVLERAQQPFVPHLIRAPGVSAEVSAAMQAGAARVITGYLTGTSGALTVNAIERDVATQKTLRWVVARGDVLSVAETLAKSFAAKPLPAPTRNQTALRQYSIGLETEGPGALTDFEQAVTADPNFGGGYLAWTRTAAQNRNRPELERALAAGLSRGASIAPLDRAYLELESANLRQDRAARVAALASIVKIDPSDAGNLRTLADAELASRRFGPAIKHYEQAVAVLPESAELWNLLSYARMFAGDYAGALAGVHEYQKRRPEDPNAIDSEGDIHFYFGKFEEAEKLYLRAYAKNPSFENGGDAWKAARARLITGDVAGAAGLFQKFEDARVKEGNAFADFWAAKWTYLTGDRANGIARMAAAGEVAKNADIRSLCFTQAAMWEAAAGRVADAGRYAGLALQPARPGTVANAAVVKFLAQPPASTAEWNRRGETQFHGAGTDAVRRLALAYAHLLAHENVEAAAEWKAIYEESNPNEQTPGFLYAAASIASGSKDAVAAIVKTNPIPEAAPQATWESLYFPALLQWRGSEDAFRKLAGRTGDKIAGSTILQH